MQTQNNKFIQNEFQDKLRETVEKLQQLQSLIQKEKIFFQNKYSQHKIKGKGKFHDVQKDVLKYQVSIYKRIFQKIETIFDKQKQTNKQKKLIQLLQQISEIEIKNQALQNNLKVQCSINQKLQADVNKLKQSQKQTQQQKIKNKQVFSKQSQECRQLLKKVQKLQRQVQIYKKKSQQFDRLGGKTGFQKNRQKIKDLKQILQKDTESKTKLKEKIKQLSNKCEILTAINQETEQKLAEIMTNRQFKRQTRDTKQNSNFVTAYQSEIYKQNNKKISNLTFDLYTKNKQEKMPQNQNKCSNPNIQIMALKGQLNQYRKKIEQLQFKNKQLIKKSNQKEVFFSKLMQES